MRGNWMGVGTLALAAFGVGHAVVGAGSDLPGWLPLQAAERDEQPVARSATPALRRLVPVELVERSQLQPVLDRLPADAVVLDLLALESLEAAQDLVQSWRVNHLADAPLVCWLAAPDSGPGLADAVRALSEAGCSALRVALVPRSPG